MSLNSLIQYATGIYAIDAMYVRPSVAAIHLIVEDGRAAFFDSGTNASLPRVLDALTSLGISVGAVDYVILSHVHLDHAGGAGAMMKEFPEARLVVHPRGARHMADPSKLMAGTKAIYGEERTRSLYGDLIPVPTERIVEGADGLSLVLADRVLTVLESPGHAKHHLCLADGKTGHIFAGDAFGISFRQLDVDGRASVFPTTSPVQFDPVAMHASVDRILQAQPAAVYVTHFGRITDVIRLGDDLHRLIDAHCDVARAAAAGPALDRHARILNGLRELLLEEKARQRWRLADSELLDLFDDDLDVNAQGLDAWLVSAS